MLSRSEFGSPAGALGLQASYQEGDVTCDWGTGKGWGHSSQTEARGRKDVSADKASEVCVGAVLGVARRGVGELGERQPAGVGGRWGRANGEWLAAGQVLALEGPWASRLQGAAPGFPWRQEGLSLC